MKLVRQDEHGRHVLALNYGRVKITRLEPDGHQMVLAVRGCGEILGEATYLGDQVRSATVTAISVCVTYVVPHLSFRRIVEEFSLSDLVLRHLTDRLRESEEIRSELAGLTPRRRIARMLLRFSLGGELRLPQADLARAVGLSRSAVALELAWLRDHGMVGTSRGRVTITDPPNLRRLADADEALLPDNSDACVHFRTDVNPAFRHCQECPITSAPEAPDARSS